MYFNIHCAMYVIIRYNYLYVCMYVIIIHNINTEYLHNAFYKYNVSINTYIISLLKKFLC